MNRRHALGLLAALGLGAALWRGTGGGASKPEFTELDDPPGFRAIGAGAISLSGAVLAGIDAGGGPDPLAEARRETRDDLCGTLFEDRAPGLVPVAYFYDYQCPICRRLSPRLRELSGVAITWHDLAGLGAASELAARAAVAARAQGGFHGFHDRMMRAAFLPTEGYIRELATGIGLDADRLIADMRSAKVSARLNRSQALADRFAIPGTPALVVGRTLAVGDIGQRGLDRLIAIEAETRGPCG